MEWYLAALKKYAVFDGRARRKEFWYFMLFNVMISLALLVIGLAIRAPFGQSVPFVVVLVPSWVFQLAMVIPSIAVSARRLHDIGNSGWWVFIVFVPFGQIVMLVLASLDTKPGPNKYGPDPKAIERNALIQPPAVTG